MFSIKSLRTWGSNQRVTLKKCREYIVPYLIIRKETLKKTRVSTLNLNGNYTVVTTYSPIVIDGTLMFKLKSRISKLAIKCTYQYHIGTQENLMNKTSLVNEIHSLKKRDNYQSSGIYSQVKENRRIRQLIYLKKRKSILTQGTWTNVQDNRFHSYINLI